jgi:hypothetical protein
MPCGMNEPVSLIHPDAVELTNLRRDGGKA